MAELQSTASTTHSWSATGDPRTYSSGTRYLIPATYDYAEGYFSGISDIPADAVIRSVEIISTNASERIRTLSVRQHRGSGTILDLTNENIKTLLDGGSRDIALRSEAYASGTISETQTKWYSASASAVIRIEYGNNTARVKYNTDATSSSWVTCEVYICDDGETWSPCEIYRYDGSSWRQCNIT